MVRSAVEGELLERERELDAGRRFLAALPAGPAALLIRGEAGIGKSAIWRRIADEARGLGYRVLVARCYQADMQLGFATLCDLFENVGDEIASLLPPAQQSALSFALRRSEPQSGMPEALTVSRGVLGALRLLAASSPVLIAIDDAQWIDPASARVLAFALRRLQGERMGALVAQRQDEQDQLFLSSISGVRFGAVELGPLTLGAIHRLVSTRLDISLPRPTLVRLHDASGGNPMFALEFARALPDSSPAEGLPMPPSLRELVRNRLVSLPPELLPLFELVATMGHPTLHVLRSAFGAPFKAQLEAAQSAGALVVDEDGRVRFAHPLLASAVYVDATPARRWELHRAAAALSTDEDERAKHLALGAAGPDEKVAALLDRAAQRARLRGAPDAASGLAEWAIRLTPRDMDSDRHRRALQAAAYLVDAGDEAGARRLLDPLIDSGVPTAVRAEALLVKASAAWNDRPRLLELLKEALQLSRGEPRLHCEALILYAWQGGHVAGDDRAAERWAHEALGMAEQIGDPGLREQAAVLAMEIASFRGRPLSPQPPEPPADALHAIRTPPWGMVSRQAVLGRQQMFRGNLAEARALLMHELDRASRQGSEVRLATLYQNLSEVELRAGNLDLARRHAEDGAQMMTEAGGNGEMIVRLALGRVAAHQGRVEDAVADLRAALQRAEGQLDVVNTIRSRASLGFLYLSLGDHAAAWASLEGLPEMVERMGANEPAATVALLPDAVEVLVALGRLDDAEMLACRFEETARELAHPWATPAAQRCRGLLRLSRGELDLAIEVLESSVTGFEQIGFTFDRARSLFALGETFRRAGRRSRAAEKLKAARELFENLGARLWLERTAIELRRAVPRPRRDHGLTAAEAQVAQLVATGSTNKETAGKLFITVATVEAHLSRIYDKLDLRSRSELARRVADGSLRLPNLAP